MSFADSSFDLLFCDHGTMSFSDPHKSVPESARLLRTGGRLVFCLSSPFFLLAIDPASDQLSERLHADYFGMHQFSWPGEETVDFQIPYGEWIRLFRENDLEVERSRELRAPEDPTSTYRTAEEHAWARR